MAQINLTLDDEILKGLFLEGSSPKTVKTLWPDGVLDEIHSA